MLKKEIYFIGGGHMSEAIIAAIRKKKTFDTIYVEELSKSRQIYLTEKYGTLSSHIDTVPKNESSIVVLAVRPQDNLSEVLESVGLRFSPATTVVSVVAGLPIHKIQAQLGKNSFPIVRVIPNTLTTTEYGYSGAALNIHAEKDKVAPFLESFGKVLYVDESYLDIITGFYPPNLIYHLIDAYVDAGVLAGLPREIAEKIAYDNLIGAVDFLKQEKVLPKELLNRNNSPGGIGIRLAYELNQHNFAGGIQTAILAAVRRTTELGGLSE